MSWIFLAKGVLFIRIRRKTEKQNTVGSSCGLYKRFCEHTGIERLPSICMPPLPETIAYEQSEKSQEVKYG